VFRAAQVGQVWVSCWILLLSSRILSAQAQGKMLSLEIVNKGKARKFEAKENYAKNFKAFKDAL